MYHPGMLLCHETSFPVFSLFSRCILLLEDLDAAFTRSVSRDASSTGAPTASNANSTTTATPETNDGSTLSLSGLLNSLDGVAAAEGRWVAMTPFETAPLM